MIADIDDIDYAIACFEGEPRMPLPARSVANKERIERRTEIFLAQVDLLLKSDSGMERTAITP